MKKRTARPDDEDPEEGKRKGTEGPEQPPCERGDSDFESFASEIWVEHFKKGDPRAMDRLFFRLRAMLMAVIRDHASYPFLPPTHSAEDVLQELWTVIFERGSLHTFRSRGRGSLRAYLRRCVDRTLISIVRKGSAQKRGGGVAPEELDRDDSSSCAIPPPRAAGPGPATRIAHDDWVSRCQRVLHGREREVWTPHFVQGLSFREIAGMLGMSDAAARSSYHRALLRLKDSGLFDEDQDDEGREE